MTKCYSYIRFSSAAQSKGSSLERQIESSKKWAARNGMVLDETLTLKDLGLSAYKADHLKKGALGKFLEQVKDGKIPPNSILIVESLDRLSREQVLTAFDLFREIIKHKIKIVTLTDGQEYDENSLNQNIGQLMISLTIMSRAFEESETKSKRLKAAWDRKRKNLEKKPLTKICPGWLKLNPEESGYEIIPERVEIIQRIFEMSQDGYGMEKIATILNSEGIQSFKKKGSGFHKSYIQKVLKSRAVLGEFQPHIKDSGQRIPTGDPIIDYFPQIISHKLFSDVQGRLKSLSSYGGGKTGKIRNLFSLISYCGYCKGKMRFINKGPSPKGGQYLVCDNSKRGLGCHYILVRYDEVEDAFLSHLDEIDASEILDADKSAKNIQIIKALDSRLADVKFKIEEGKKKYSNLKSFVANSGDSRIYDDIYNDMITIKDAESQLLKEARQIEDKLTTIKNSESSLKIRLKSMKELIKAISSSDDGADGHVDLRLKLRTAIRKIVSRIEYFPGGKFLPEEQAELLLKMTMDHFRETNPNAADWEISRKRIETEADIANLTKAKKEQRAFIIYYKTGNWKIISQDTFDSPSDLILKSKFVDGKFWKKKTG